MFSPKQNALSSASTSAVADRTDRAKNGYAVDDCRSSSATPYDISGIRSGKVRSSGLAGSGWCRARTTEAHIGPMMATACKQEAAGAEEM